MVKSQMLKCRNYAVLFKCLCVMNIVFIAIWLNAEFMEKMDTNSR